MVNKITGSLSPSSDIIEHECLAVIFVLKQFRAYVYGTKFEIVTDHASLRWLHNLKEPEGRLARWALKLQALTTVYCIDQVTNIKMLMACRNYRLFTPLLPNLKIYILIC